MILVHVWDASNCVLRLVWRSTAAVRRLKPLTLAATIACGGITVVPPVPPGEAHPPPPPSQIVVTPPPPVGSYPPPWSVTPPAEIYAPPVIPIPLGPVLPGPEVEQQTFIPAGSPEGPTLRGLSPEIVGEVGPAAPTQICDTVPMPPGVTVITPPESKVSEPAGLLFVGLGLACLGLLRYARPVEPAIKVTILSMEPK